MEYYNKIINYSNDIELPKRSDFIDKDENKIQNSIIQENDDLLFNSFSNYEKNCKLTYTDYGYKLILFGALQCGSKACVILDNIKVFFDIRIPDDVLSIVSFSQTIDNEVNGLCKVNPVSEIVYHKPLKGYIPNEVPYIRLTFNNVSDRKKAKEHFEYNFSIGSGESYGKRNEIIEYSNKLGGLTKINDSKHNILELAEDDKTSYGFKYYLSVARRYKFNLVGWNVIKDYTFYEDDCNLVYYKNIKPFIKEDIEYVFLVSVENIKSADQCGIDVSVNQNLFHDKIMTACWDLETYSNHDTGIADNQEDTKDSFIFLDSMVFSWHYSSTDIFRVCLSTIPALNRKDCLIIKCKDQQELIEAKMKLLENMRPDLIMGFNDSKYDWVFLYARAKMFNIHLELFKSMSSIYLEDTDLEGTYADKYYFGYHPQQIKISSEQQEKGCMSCILPGIMSIDMRFVLWKMFPNQDGKCSLAYCLGKFGLGGKEDISYRTLFRIYNLCKQFKTYYKNNNLKFNDVGVLTHINNNAYHSLNVYADSTDPDYNKLINTIEYIIDLEGSGYIPFSSGYEKIYEIHEKTISEIKDIIAGDTLGGSSNKGISQAINYCNIDSKRCQDLLVVSNCLNDKRELAAISYTSLFESFYRADGIRVYNLVMGTAFEPEWNLVCSSNFIKSNDDKKYPGAYVVVPKKGLYRDTKVNKYKRILKDIQDSSCENISDKELHNEIKNKLVKDITDKIIETTKSSIGYSEIEKKITNNDTNLISDRPCVGLDFSSLYPSVEMCYNLSPEMIILNEEIYKKLKSEGVNLLELSFTYGLPEQKEENKEIITVWVVQHKHPIRSIINEEFNFTDEHKLNYTKYCDTSKLNELRNKMSKTTIEDWKDYGMGIYPFILKKLFDKRKMMKKNLFKYEGMIEILSSVYDRTDSINAMNFKEQFNCVMRYCDEIIEEQTIKFNETKTPLYASNKFKFELGKKNIQSEWIDAGLHEFIEDCELKKNYYDMKQKNLKVYMNTFYGITGAKTNALGMIHVAGATTVKGKYNTKLVKKYVEKQGMRVLYGDTDSLYISLGDKEFTEIDDLYFSGKISKKEYWEEMIYITMKFMDSFKDEVNNFLFIDNSTLFLNMAYEEVLYPFIMSGKKKYMGIQHLQIANVHACDPNITLSDFMNSKSIFTRGFEIIKRGVSDFLKLVFYKIVKDAFCLTETRTLLEICEQSLEDIHNKKWDPQLFAKTKRYKLPGNKPDGTKKQGNVSVLNFITKMKNLQQEYPHLKLELPEIGTRYKYVVVKRYPYKYTLNGRKEDIKAHDKHEFLDLFDNNEYQKVVGNLEIDLDHYINNELIGQIARLIIYHNKYDPYTLPGMDDEEMKKADKKAIDNAKKMLEKYYKEKFATTYQDRGHIHKNIYGDVSKIVDNKMKSQYHIGGGVYKKITSKNIMTYVESKSSLLDKNITEEILLIIDKNAETLANKLARTIPKLKVVKILENMYETKYADRDTELYIKYMHGRCNIIGNIKEKLYIKIIETRNKIVKIISDIQKNNMKVVNEIENSINKINNLYNINKLGIEPNRKDNIIFKYDVNEIQNIINSEVKYDSEFQNTINKFNDIFTELVYYKTQAKKINKFMDSVNKNRINTVKNNIETQSLKEYRKDKSFADKFYDMFKDVL